jgi:hypothetical protein
MPQPVNIDAIVGIVWVHVFEEDTAAGAVFRPEDSDIPLSRRPRERFELSPGGKAAWITAGADDRPARGPAQWTEEGDEVVIRDGSGKVRCRVVQRSRERLIVKLFLD